MCVCVCFHELLSLASFFFFLVDTAFLKALLTLCCVQRPLLFTSAKVPRCFSFFFSRFQTLHYETVRRIKRGKKKDNDITGVVKAVSVGWA